MFVWTGDQPFLDYVFTIQADGSNLQTVLAPTKHRSFTAASGNSLQGKLIVKVHQTVPAARVENHLFVYHPALHKWHRLKTREGIEGDGVISPDECRVVYALAELSRPSEYELWVSNIDKDEATQLTKVEPGSWDGYPSWRGDGEEIAFIRFRKTKTGIARMLMRIPSAGGKPITILGPDENVGGGSFGSDGKHLSALSKKGLEIVATEGQSRRVILQWENFPDRVPVFGAIAWSRTSNKIAFSMLNRITQDRELWIVSADGSGARSIYRLNGGRIQTICFTHK